MDREIFDQTTWKVQEVAKPGKILAKLDPKKPDIGYFRSLTGDQNGHEYLAHRLGGMLGLPVAKVRLREAVEGEAGLEAGSVSFLVAPGASEWGQFPIDKKEKLEENLDTNQLLLALTFDIWTCNTDRNSENFQYVKFPGDQKYHFFLIDHTECFKSIDNHNFTELIRIQDFQKLFKSNFDSFKPHIETIKNLDDNSLKEEINCIPVQFLPDQRKIEVDNLLKNRTEKLEQYVTEFCNL